MVGWHSNPKQGEVSWLVVCHISHLIQVATGCKVWHELSEGSIMTEYVVVEESNTYRVLPSDLFGSFK